MYADDAMMLPPNQPMVREGDLAYQVGTYAIPDTKTPDQVKFVNIFRRQQDGSRKLLVAIYNSDNPRCKNRLVRSLVSFIAFTTRRLEKHMSQEQIQQAAEAYYEAINRVVHGDMTLMDEVWSHADDVTNMGPFGGRQVGWQEVRAEFAREAALNLKGRVTAEDMRVVVGSDLAYVICVEHAEHQNVDGRTVEVRFRATNIYRLETGVWKLIHHHNDLSPALMGEGN
jgi:ketosteroid isomerase-like protein